MPKQALLQHADYHIVTQEYESASAKHKKPGDETWKHMSPPGLFMHLLFYIFKPESFKF